MTKKNARAEALAARIEQGAAELAAFAEGLSESEWRKSCNDRDRRTLGVLVHHVGTMYPIEVEAAKAIASGKSVDDVTWEVVAGINAKHSAEHGGVTRAQALELLRANSRAAAQAIRAFTDEQLDRAAPVSLNSDAPLTCQFFLEDHPVRHSYHHLARIKAALGR